ncbi:MAG TPA: hypothetical protein VIX84_11500 [Acidimicrobiales bacterium]
MLLGRAEEELYVGRGGRVDRVDKSTAIQDESSVRPSRHSRFVCDDYHGASELLGRLAEQIDDDVRVVRVEGGRRLVGENDLRVRNEGTGDRDALLLASREPGGQTAQFPGDAHPIGKSSDSVSVDVLTVETQRERDVFRNGQSRHQVEALEDESHSPTPEYGEAAAAQASEVRPTQADRSRGRAVEAGGALEEGRLPRTRGSDNCRDGAGGERRGDIDERVIPVPSAAEVLAERSKLDRRTEMRASTAHSG